MADNLNYAGELGNYELQFDGKEYVPASRLRGYSGLGGIDWDELERVVLKKNGNTF